MLTTFLTVSSNNVFSAGSGSDSKNTKTKSLAYLSAEKFINKKPHSSWELNTTYWLWQPVGGWPADSKHNGGTKAYFWNTETESIEPVIDSEPEE